MVLQAKNGESSISTVWNELWPAYEGFLNVLETEAQVGQHPVCTAPCPGLITNILTIPTDNHLPCINLCGGSPALFVFIENILEP